MAGPPVGARSSARCRCRISRRQSRAGARSHELRACVGVEPRRRQHPLAPVRHQRRLRDHLRLGPMLVVSRGGDHHPLPRPVLILAPVGPHRIHPPAEQPQVRMVGVGPRGRRCMHDAALHRWPLDVRPQHRLAILKDRVVRDGPDGHGVRSLGAGVAGGQRTGRRAWRIPLGRRRFLPSPGTTHSTGAVT